MEIIRTDDEQEALDAVRSFAGARMLVVVPDRNILLRLWQFTGQVRPAPVGSRFNLESAGRVVHFTSCLPREVNCEYCDCVLLLLPRLMSREVKEYWRGIIGVEP